MQVARQWWRQLHQKMNMFLSSGGFYSWHLGFRFWRKKKKSRGMVILRFVCCLRNRGLHGAMVDRAGKVAYFCSLFSAYKTQLRNLSASFFDDFGWPGVPRGTHALPIYGDLMTSCHVVLSRRLAYEQTRLVFPRDRGQMSLRIYYKHPSYGNQFVSFVFCWCCTSCRFPCKGKN